MLLCCKIDCWVVFVAISAVSVTSRPSRSKPLRRTQQSSRSRKCPSAGQLLVLHICLLRALQPDGADMDHKSVQPLQLELVRKPKCELLM
jgi:hypothetical protein